MRRITRPVIRGVIAFLTAIGLLLAAELTPIGLVAEGQTAGAVPANQTGSCTAITGNLTPTTGLDQSVQCPGGGTLGITAPPGAVGGDGTLNLLQIGDILGAQNNCSGANQLPILAAQHFSSSWIRPGQPPSTTINLPATIKLPISPSLLAEAGGSPSRLLILHSLPNGAVTPVSAGFSSDGTTASFQSSNLGDFYAVALPAGLPAPYSGVVGQVNFQNHTFVLSNSNGSVTVQSYDRQGGTAILHQDGSPASFNEIPNAKSVQVNGIPSPARCGSTGTVVAKSILLDNALGTNTQIPSQLPDTGLGGMAAR